MSSQDPTNPSLHTDIVRLRARPNRHETITWSAPDQEEKEEQRRSSHVGLSHSVSDGQCHVSIVNCQGPWTCCRETPRGTS